MQLLDKYLLSRESGVRDICDKQKGVTARKFDMTQICDQR